MLMLAGTPSGLGSLSRWVRFRFSALYILGHLCNPFEDWYFTMYRVLLIHTTSKHCPWSYVLSRVIHR